MRAFACQLVLLSTAAVRVKLIFDTDMGGGPCNDVDYIAAARTRAALLLSCIQIDSWFVSRQ